MPDTCGQMASPTAALGCPAVAIEALPGNDGNIDVDIIDCVSLSNTTQWSMQASAGLVDTSFGGTDWQLSWSGVLSVYEGTEWTILAFWLWNNVITSSNPFTIEFGIVVDPVLSGSTVTGGDIYSGGGVTNVTIGRESYAFNLSSTLLPTGDHVVGLVWRITEGTGSFFPQVGSKWTAIPDRRLNVSITPYRIRGELNGDSVCISEPAICCPDDGGVIDPSSSGPPPYPPPSYWWCIDSTSCYYGTEDDAAAQGAITGGPYVDEESCAAECSESDCTPSRTALTSGVATGSELTLSDVTVSGGRRLIVRVFLAKVAPTTTILGITFNGTSLGQDVGATFDITGSHYHCQIWSLWVSDTVTADIVVTIGGSATIIAMAEAILWPCGGGTTLGDTDSAFGVDSAAECSFTSLDNSYNAVAAISVTSSAVIYGNEFTLGEQWSVANGGWHVEVVGSAENPKITSPATFSRWAMCGISYA